MVNNLELLLQEYVQRVHNLDDPDEFGLDEELVLATRSSVAKHEGWLPKQEEEINHLDEQLAAHWKQFKGTLPHHLSHPRSEWWWFLNEGPQVREEAKHLDTQPAQA